MDHQRGPPLVKGKGRPVLERRGEELDPVPSRVYPRKIEGLCPLFSPGSRLVVPASDFKLRHGFLRLRRTYRLPLYSRPGPAVSITAQTPRKPTAASCRWAVRAWVDRKKKGGGPEAPRFQIPMYSDGVRGLGGIRVASHPRFSHSLRQRQAAASVVKGTTRQVQEWEKKSLTRYVTLFSVGQERPRFKSTAGPALSITAQTPRKPTAASCRWAVRVWVDRGGGRSPPLSPAR
jgi:hypothetical protein